MTLLNHTVMFCLFLSIYINGILLTEIFFMYKMNRYVSIYSIWSLLWPIYWLIALSFTLWDIISRKLKRRKK